MKLETPTLMPVMDHPGFVFVHFFSYSHRAVSGPGMGWHTSGNGAIMSMHGSNSLLS